jgi:hypothetical protein
VIVFNTNWVVWGALALLIPRDLTADANEEIPQAPKAIVTMDEGSQSSWISAI